MTEKNSKNLTLEQQEHDKEEQHERELGVAITFVASLEQ
jgi:hypothetical protein